MVIYSGRLPTLQDVIYDDLNLKVWSAVMKRTLKGKGLWDVIVNRVPPDPSKILGVASSLKVEELCKWRELVRKDMKALQVMQSSLTDSVFQRSLSAASARDLWDMLHELPEYQLLALHPGRVTYDDNMWVIYCAATNHMSPHGKFFTTLDTTYRARVRLITGGIAMAKGIGDVTIVTKEGIKKTIKNVLYVPEIQENALSVGQMMRTGYGVEISQEKCTIWDKTTGEILGVSVWESRGFFLTLEVIEGYHRCNKRKVT